MLLSNMSKLDAVARQILALRVPFTIVTSEPSPAPEGTADDNAHEDAPAAKMAKLETATEEIAALDLLLEVFLKGEGKKYNPNANYDFLASVFANVSLVRRPLAPRAPSPAPRAALTPPLRRTASSRPRLPPRHARPHDRASTRQAYLVHRAPVDDQARWRRVDHQVRSLPLSLSPSSPRSRS